MNDDDPLVLWRLAADLSVEDAAILMAGGDPSAVDAEQIGYAQYDNVKRTTGHPGYVATLSALKNAILQGHLPASIRYRFRDIGVEFGVEDNSRSWVVSKVDLRTLLVPNDKLNLGSGRIRIVREPDWSASTVDVDDLRSWLRGRGWTGGFFFPTEEPVSEDFLDPAHDHFAPELALAVRVWRALETEQGLRKSPKAAAKTWIESNPEAWQGNDPLSAEARERIATLVNWRRSGGAPSTGE